MAEKLSFFLEEWEKCDPDGFASRTTRKETLLETIARVRLADVRAAEQVLPLSELKAKVRAQRLPPPLLLRLLTRRPLTSTCRGRRWRRRLRP
eukprot:COSAG01_NODE_661_length_14426_cov_32.272632_14_plen_93_part_00